MIRYRGEALARSALPRVLAQAKADRERLQGVLAAHDRAARAAHLGAARLLGKGWEDQLRGLAHTLHYLAHQHANVIDAHGLLLNVWALAAADGTISEREIPGIIAAANESQAALAAVYQPSASVRLPEGVAVRLDKPSWKAQLGEELGLPPATRDHLAGNWLQVEQGWVNAAVGHLQDAVDATLDELLEAEAHVARCLRTGEDPLDAPEPAALPANYPTLHPGSERKRTRRLGAWDRFQTADGIGPGVLRFGAAAAVLAPPVYFGLHFGSAIVLVHNGLDAPVRVELNELAIALGPFEERLVDVTPGTVALRATTPEGVEIERRSESATSLFQPYVYNVAGADGFYRTWIRYGSGDAPEPNPLGASPWFQPQLDHVGEAPPESISSDSPKNHSVLSGTAGFPPGTVLSAAPPEAHAAIIGAHLRYDDPESADYAVWAQVAGQAGVDGKQLVVDRATGSSSPALGRLWQELDAKAACAAHTPAARAAPENADLAYLAIRCLPDGPESDVAFAEAHARFPESGWIRWATATSAGRQADWARMGELAASPFPRPLEGAAMELRLQAARMAGLGVEVQLATVEGQRNAEGYKEFLRAEATGNAGNPEGYDAEARAALLRAGGHIEAAEAVADLPDEERALTPCSDGASAGARNGLPALAPRPGTVGALCRLAVLSREAPPDDAALAALAPLGEELAVPLGKLLRAPAAEVVTTGDALAELSFPQTRSLLRLVGVLRLGEEAPQRWRDEARALCLPWQRPWLHP